MQVKTVERINLWSKRVMTLVFPIVMVLALAARWPAAGQQLPVATTTAAVESPEQLQQLVAPIALYPDALVAQILAAATYPTQVVQADRWLEQRPNLQGEQLAGTVDQQPWDPSVKALTAFPSVLANLDKNLSWTEELGNAYFNQQQDVLEAVQVMRGRAEDAGNLKSSPEETVVHQGPTIVIAPVRPDFCYLPIYDPWIVYGAPVTVYPGYFYDAWYGPPFISFGPAIGLGFFGGFGWGWPAWGFNWGRRVVVFNHTTYISHSRFFSPGGSFVRGRGVIAPARGGPLFRANHGFSNHSAGANSRFGNGWANRGAVTPRANTSPRSGPFNGARWGGSSRGPGSSGAAGAGRARPGGGRNFGGGARGGGSHWGGSHGGGGSGRHR